MVLVAREAQGDRELAGFTPVVQPLTAEMNQDGRRVLAAPRRRGPLLLIACGNTPLSFSSADCSVSRIRRFASPWAPRAGRSSVR